MREMNNILTHVNMYSFIYNIHLLALISPTAFVVGRYLVVGRVVVGMYGVVVGG